MKKIISLLLFCIVLLNFTSCGKDKNNETDKNTKIEDVTIQETEVNLNSETEKFNNLTEDITTRIEKDEDLSNNKEEIAKIKQEIQNKVAEADKEDKSDYDMQQIAIFMMEKALEDYETAKTDGDEEKMRQAKDSLDTARKIWSSEVEQ